LRRFEDETGEIQMRMNWERVRRKAREERLD
jgi:hypothetical protein